MIRLSTELMTAPMPCTYQLAETCPCRSSNAKPELQICPSICSRQSNSLIAKVPTLWEFAFKAKVSRRAVEGTILLG